MKEIQLTASQVEDMTISELSLYWVTTDPKERSKMYSMMDVIQLHEMKEKLTAEEYLEFMERKNKLWQ